MSGSYRNNDFAFSGLILFVFMAVFLAYLLSHTTTKQNNTYAENQCAQQQLKHAGKVVLPNVKDMQPPAADKGTNQTYNKQEDEPDWCDLAAQQSMANSTRGMEIAAWVAVVLTIAGVILIGGTLYYTAGTLDEAKRTAAIAERTLAASERPWVSIQPKIASPFVFTEDEGRISIQFDLKNFGKSPAIHVEVNFKILPLPYFTLRELNAITDAAKNRSRKKMFGHKIFPGDTFAYTISLPISRGEIYACMAEAGVPEVDINFISPAIVGCVVYTSPTDNINHVTEFLAHIGKVDPTNPKASLGIETDIGEVAIDELELRLSFGTGQAD